MDDNRKRKETPLYKRELTETQIREFRWKRTLEELERELDAIADQPDIDWADGLRMQVLREQIDILKFYYALLPRLSPEEKQEHAELIHEGAPLEELLCFVIRTETYHSLPPPLSPENEKGEQREEAEPQPPSSLKTQQHPLSISLSHPKKGKTLIERLRQNKTDAAQEDSSLLYFFAAVFFPSLLLLTYFCLEQLLSLQTHSSLVGLGLSLLGGVWLTVLYIWLGRRKLYFQSLSDTPYLTEKEWHLLFFTAMAAYTAIAFLFWLTD